MLDEEYEEYVLYILFDFNECIRVWWRDVYEVIKLELLISLDSLFILSVGCEIGFFLGVIFVEVCLYVNF